MSADNIYPVTDQGTADPGTGFESVPVKLDPDDLAAIRAVKEFTPVFGAWQTLVFLGLAAETAAQVLLPADLRRRKATIRIQGTGVSQVTQGSRTTPAANSTIANFPAASLVAGTYTLNWAVDLDGTPGAGDTNNMELLGTGFLPGSPVIAEFNGAVGHYPQTPIELTIPTGVANPLKVQAIGAGTAGAIYSAEMSLTPWPATGYVLVGAQGQVGNGQGGRLYTGQDWKLENHAPLYIAGDGVTPLTVTVLVERDSE